MLPALPSDKQSLCHSAPKLVIPSQTFGGHFGYICIVTLTQSISLQPAKTPCSLTCSVLLCAIDQTKATAVTLPATQVAQQRVTLAHKCIQHPWAGGCPGYADLYLAELAEPLHTRLARPAKQHGANSQLLHRNGSCCSDGYNSVQLAGILETGTRFLSCQERMVFCNTQ